MLLLASTSDLIQVINDVTGTIDVHASYIDYLSGAITPGRKNTAITTNATTTVVASPTGSTVRNVKTLVIRNTHASTAVTITVQHYDGTTTVSLHKVLMGPGTQLSYVDGAGFVLTPATNVLATWPGTIIAAFGDGDPGEAMRMATQGGSIAPTPTNISTTVARISYFRPKQNITVNKARYYGVGATTSIYRIAIYNADTLTRLTAETAFTTVANTWGTVFSSLDLTLSAGQLYFLACSVNNTGTTAGVLACGTTVAATTGQDQVLPKDRPGSLDIDSGYMSVGMAQFAVTSGALPDPAATIATQAAWTGGMPLFFLDNSNA